jgi:hypothetical protein
MRRGEEVQDIIDKPECVMMLNDISDAKQRLSLMQRADLSCENAFVHCGLPGERLFDAIHHVSGGTSRR